jgi:predicted transcriptional regulator
MDEAKIEYHLKHVPTQMIELVGTLDKRSKWAVFAALLENKQMYFNQIKEEFGADATEIDRILKSLVAGGLIFKHAKSFDDVKNNRTYYAPSLLGEMFYDSMFNLVIPRKSCGNEGFTAYQNQNILFIPSQLSEIQIGQQLHKSAKMILKVSGNGVVNA